MVWDHGLQLLDIVLIDGFLEANDVWLMACQNIGQVREPVTPATVVGDVTYLAEHVECHHFSDIETLGPSQNAQERHQCWQQGTACLECKQNKNKKKEEKEEERSATKRCSEASEGEEDHGAYLHRVLGEGEEEEEEKSQTRNNGVCVTKTPFLIGRGGF